MKASDIRTKTQDQLTDELASLMEKTARVKQVRKDIARIKTIAAEKSAGKKA